MEKEVAISVKKNPNGSYRIFVQYCKAGVYPKSTGITLRLNESQLDFIKRKNKIPSNVGIYELFNSRIHEVKDRLTARIEACNKPRNKMVLFSVFFYTRK
jgi:hypothetical protein